jgi:hypothetical protein
MQLNRTELNFVACPSYHGATLLALLLNNHSQLVSLGDSVPSQLDDSPCGCGQMVKDCTFWQKIADRSRSGPDGQSLFSPLPVISRNNRRNLYANVGFGHMARVLGPNAWRPVQRRCKTFLDEYQGLIETTCELSQASTFIDGSKNPVKIFALQNMLRPRPVMRVLHLTRDPRAFIHSCRKYSELPLEINTRYWRRYHRFAVDRFAHQPHIEYLCLRLEDLCTAPDEQLEAVQRFFGVEPETLTTPNRYESNCHLVGNRNAILKFDGQLRLDTKYREGLSAEDQQRIMEQTNPLAARFGYT